MTETIFPEQQYYIEPPEPVIDELDPADVADLTALGANWVNNNHKSGIGMQEFIDFGMVWLAGKPAYANKSISREQIRDIGRAIIALHGTPDTWE